MLGSIEILDATGLLQQDSAASLQDPRWCAGFINQSMSWRSLSILV
jgi:hypothetical protein